MFWERKKTHTLKLMIWLKFLLFNWGFCSKASFFFFFSTFFTFFHVYRSSYSQKKILVTGINQYIHPFYYHMFKCALKKMLRTKLTVCICCEGLTFNIEMLNRRWEADWGHHGRSWVQVLFNLNFSFVLFQYLQTYRRNWFKKIFLHQNNIIF